MKYSRFAWTVADIRTVIIKKQKWQNLHLRRLHSIWSYLTEVKQLRQTILYIMRACTRVEQLLVTNNCSASLWSTFQLIVMWLQFLLSLFRDCKFRLNNNRLTRLKKIDDSRKIWDFRIDVEHLRFLCEVLNVFVEWARWGLNPGPEVYETPALTTELQARFAWSIIINLNVRLTNHCLKIVKNIAAIIVLRKSQTNVCTIDELIRYAWSINLLCDNWYTWLYD